MNGNYQYITDLKGTPTAIIIPITEWKNMYLANDTEYLSKSTKMTKRILDAKSRNTGFTLKEVHEKLGI
jgi:hypothetical protein